MGKKKNYRIIISLKEDGIEVESFSQPKSLYSRKELEEELDKYENRMLDK